MTKLGIDLYRRLAPQELVVLVKICEGKSDQQIALEMNVSYQTTKNRVSSILHKAGQLNRIKLIIFCFRHGVVRCPCADMESLCHQVG